MIEMFDRVITKIEYKFKDSNKKEIIVPKGTHGSVVDIFDDDFLVEISTSVVSDSDGCPFILEFKENELELYKKN